MKTLVGITLLVALVARAAIGQPATTPPLRAQAAQITGSIVQGRGFELLSDLTENVGARVTGTKSYANAVAWAKRELTAAGAQNVNVEKATLASTWERGTATARVVGRRARSIDVESFGWAPSTPGGNVSGPVVVIENVDPAAWKPLESKLRGAIVVVTDRTGKLATFVSFMTSVPLWGKAGARAVISGMATMPNNVRGQTGFPGEMAAVPVATIGSEDAAFFVRHASEGLRLELSITNKVGKAADVESVVGEIKGSDASAGWLIVSAHLDSWDAATGTQDNGSGVVMAIETARALAAIGGLKRTVRFALWAGEEEFLIGSRAYVAAHASELDSCVAVLNTDSGAGHVIGWNTDGRDDVSAALSPLVSPYLRGLGGNRVTTRHAGGSDHESFMLGGVPTLDLAVDESTYDMVLHKRADTIEKVDVHALLSGAAVVAITAYVLAMSTQRLAPRLDHDGIQRLLDRIETTELMRFMKVWK